MSFNICGQCQYFERESHPEDEEQCGICCGWEPPLLVIDNEFRMVERYVDAGRRACVAFREERR